MRKALSLIQFTNQNNRQTSRDQKNRRPSSDKFVVFFLLDDLANFDWKSILYLLKYLLGVRFAFVVVVYKSVLDAFTKPLKRNVSQNAVVRSTTSTTKL